MTEPEFDQPARLEVRGLESNEKRHVALIGKALLGRLLLLMLAVFLAAPVIARDTYDLAHVDGIESFAGSKGAQELLARNGFVVAAPEFRQIFEPYIESPLPLFITPDSAWHTYHFLFEHGIKELEQAQSDRQKRFSKLLLAAAQEQVNQGHAEFHELVGYASVGLALQDTNYAATISNEQKRLLNALTSGSDSVAAPIGFELSPVTFRPQSFYAETPELSAYCRAHQWYATVDFRLSDDRETRLALCLSWIVANNPELLQLWNELTTPYNTLVAMPEDGSVDTYLTAATNVLTPNVALDAIENRATAIRKKLQDNPKLPRINDQLLPPEDYVRFARVTAGFRLLPGRQLPCTVCLQNTVDPKIPRRFTPSGLDFFAASKTLRSSPALKAEESLVGKKVLPTILAADPGAMPDSLYGESMNVLSALQKPLPAQVPAPFRADAWSDLQLSTQLGAWAEQRHTWALHAKPAFGVSGIAETPPGVVAPYPEFFAGLATLSRQTAFALQTNSMTPYLTNFADVCDRLAGLAAKELAGKIPTQEETLWISRYGEMLGGFHLYGGNSWLVPEDDFAIVSRIFTIPIKSSVLYAGVTRPQALYLILPYKDRLQLYRGAVMSYREFERPDRENLDDARWQEIVRTGKVPPAPEFTASFMQCDQPDAEQTNRVKQLSFAEEDLAKPTPSHTKLTIKETFLTTIPSDVLTNMDSGPISSDDERHVIFVEKSGGKARLVRDGNAGKQYDVIESETFSPDSRHVVYAVKGSNYSCVVMDGVEGKHFQEIRPLFSEEIPFMFSSNSVHFACKAALADGGECVVIDGIEGPVFDEILPQRFSFSENSEHFAYAGARGNHVFVLKDNKELVTGDSVGNVFLSANGQRFACFVQRGSAWFANVDGVESHPWRSIGSDRDCRFSADGGHFTYSAQTSGGSYVQVLDAKEMPASIEGAVFSPNGKSWAVAHEDETGTSVTLNGIPGKKYRGGILELTFSPDGSRLGYFVEEHFGGTPAAVIHGEQEIEGMAPELFTGIQFSPDGKHYALHGKRGQKAVVIIDGKQYPGADDGELSVFNEVTFSPDGGRWAYRSLHGGKTYWVVSGTEFGPYGAAPSRNWDEGEPFWFAVGQIHFSPDGRHFAFRATRNGRNFLIVDGSEKEIHGDWFPNGIIVYDSDSQLHFLMLEQGKVFLTQATIERD